MSETHSIGLLEKASQARARYSHSDPGLRKSDWTKGIDANDQKEILDRIEELTKSARIASEPELFAVKAKKSGILLPILVNLIAILVVAGALFGISTYWKRNQTATAANDASLNSAEGKLLAELKRSSSSELEAKDKEIADIKTRMETLDKEKGALASSIEERIKAREAELRAALKAELDAERRRLEAQGYSDDVVAAKMKDFEAKKNAEYQAKLADFQKSAEAERERAEANYAKLRADYEKNLTGLADERKRIQDEAQKREIELRTSLEARAKSLESENAQAAQGLAAAKAELQRLEDQRKTTQSAEDRITGLYATVQRSLSDGRYADAALQAAGLRTYLDDPAVAALPQLASRREADIFAAESLSALAKLKLDAASSDTSRLLVQAELVKKAQDAAAAGKAALEAGDFKAADARYHEALATVPTIMAAHDYFTSRAADEEAARKAQLESKLAEANVSWKAAEYEAALTAYEDALVYLPLSAGERRDYAARLEKSAVEAASRSKAISASKAAREIIAQARRDAASSQWEASFSGYLSVLTDFSAAKEAPEAVKGLGTAMLAMEKDAADKSVAAETASLQLQSEIDVLKASLAEAQIRYNEDLDAARKEGAASAASMAAQKDSLLAEKDGRIAELQKLLAQAETQSQAAGGVLPEPGKNASIEELRAANEALRNAAGKYEAILTSYRAYTQSEDAILAKPDANVVDAHAALDGFLSGPEARALFPDLRDRIARYEQAFQEAGQKEVLFNAADILKNGLSIEDGAARAGYFSALRQRYANDEAMLSFIAEVEKRAK